MGLLPVVGLRHGCLLHTHLHGESPKLQHKRCEKVKITLILSHLNDCFFPDRFPFDGPSPLQSSCCSPGWTGKPCHASHNGYHPYHILITFIPTNTTITITTRFMTSSQRQELVILLSRFIYPNINFSGSYLPILTQE